jgi:cytosine deaminase
MIKFTRYRYLITILLVLSTTEGKAHMNASVTDQDKQFYQEALLEAKKGLEEGGIPIGSVLACDGKILGRGHNRRVQQGSAILHGEMDALENAGRLSAATYARCTLYTTLSPCPMCSGTATLYKIPRIVIGENKNFMGDEAALKQKGMDLIVLQDQETTELMGTFIKNNPRLWNEDIGEQD